VKIRAFAAVAILSVMVFVATRHWNRRVEPLRSGITVTRVLAPDFSVTDLSGQTLQLSHYRGKLVLLNFWATWCAPCRSEIPRFVDLQNKYGKEGLQIIGISLDDDPKPVRAFYQQLRMNYPVAIGDAKLAEQYGGVLGLPVSFLIGRDGRMYAKHVGESDTSQIEREIKSLL
jgi:cytochrome c biogenesis protein CcmG, thiol:disulfide interchange protein DsbE